MLTLDEDKYVQHPKSSRVPFPSFLPRRNSSCAYHDGDSSEEEEEDDDDDLTARLIPSKTQI